MGAGGGEGVSGGGGMSWRVSGAPRGVSVGLTQRARRAQPRTPCAARMHRLHTKRASRWAAHHLAQKDPVRTHLEHGGEERGDQRPKLHQLHLERGVPVTRVEVSRRHNPNAAREVWHVLHCLVRDVGLLRRLGRAAAARSAVQKVHPACWRHPPR